MRDGELPEIFVLGADCLMAKEKFGTVVNDGYSIVKQAAQLNHARNALRAIS